MILINHTLSPSSIEAEELPAFVGKTVQIHGSIYKIREMSGFAFVLLRTKRTVLQCVYSEEYSRFPLHALKENMCVRLTGEVVHDQRSRTGAELRLLEFEQLSEAAAEPPVVINQKEVSASLETLLDYRPVTLRNAKQRAIFQLQAGLCRGIRSFLEQNRFTEIHSPKIVFSGAEGGANIFALDYFGTQAFLAQSPQFYKQAMVGVFERVYEIAPVFRAEKHDTSRHINEYTSVDLEMGFLDSFYDICRLETKLLSEVFSFLRAEYAPEIALLHAEIPQVTEIPALRFAEAKELISRVYHREITDPEDFDPEEEKLLCAWIKQQTGCDFVFVTHYRSSKRPFYAMDTEKEPQVTESFDLLFRGMEITTGGQRIHDYDAQVEKMQARGMNPQAFESFLMAHRCGLPPHGGLGLGLERLTAQLLGLKNVRYATLFPRDIHRLTP